MSQSSENKEQFAKSNCFNIVYFAYTCIQVMPTCVLNWHVFWPDLMPDYTLLYPNTVTYKRAIFLLLLNIFSASELKYCSQNAFTHFTLFY